MDLRRRTFLELAASGFMGALLARAITPAIARGDGLPAPAPTPAAGPAPKAKAIVLLWLNGGPSHVDTWDPKPGRPTGGPFKSIPTRAPGISISEHLPHVAEIADRLAVVRGMSSREGNHQRAQYLLHTGYIPNGSIEHPSLGAWMSSKLGSDKDELPAFASIGGPSFGPGFLGVQNAPFVLPKAGGVPANAGLPPGVDEARFERRASGLEMLENRFAQETQDPMVAGRRAVYAKAVRLMHSPKMATFDLSSEPDSVRAAYGESDFGKGCLLARRLVENGVKFVEVVLDGWDTHRDAFTREQKLMGMLDPAMAALVKDLEQRGLLSSTIVACMGEFGRTPKINGNDGRDHHPGAWSAVLAGGGIKGGVVHGETDADGDKVVRDPETVADLMATMVSLMGLDPTASVMTPIGRPIAITDQGTPMRAILA
jgi:uncharacterized protein (DUF1501 family)